MIRQKFWKELRLRLCPRQNWHKDEDNLKCQCCRLPFRFYRRKHHCRFCGKIYCHNCSDLFINGTYLGLSQKYVRFCQFCRETIQKIKQDLNRLTYMIDEDEELVREPEEENIDSDDDENSYFFSLKHIFGSVEKDEMQKIIEYLESESKSICKKFYKKCLEVGGISHQFQGSRLLETVNRILCDCKMNILPQQFQHLDNYMDVGQYIEIKTLQGEPGQLIEAVEGVVLQKNVSIKGMQTHFDQPQVIVVENNLDQALVKATFEELIENNAAIYELIEEKIMRLNPDIIFVEKTVSKELLKFFCGSKICTISGLSKKELVKIIHLCGVKPIKNVISVGRDNNRFIGTLNSMKMVTKQKSNQSLIYLEKPLGVYTLLVSERDSERQQSLEKYLKKLMRVIRQVHLQKFLIYIDYEMTIDHPISGVLMSALNPMYKESIEKLKPFNLLFYKVVLKQIKESDLNKNEKDYCKLLKKEYMLDLCGEGIWQRFQPYTQADSTIGNFLLTMATNLMKKCQTCKLTHRKRYYFSDRGIEITANYIGPHDQEDEKAYLNEKDLTIQHMTTFMKRYREDSIIFSYFKCEKCGKLTTKKSKIGKNYLKNSIHYFMMLLSSISPPQEKLSEDKSRPSNNSDPKECKHLQNHRYLQTFNMEFKFQVFSLTTYSLDNIDIQVESSMMIIDANLTKFIEQLTKKTLMTRNTYLVVVNNWLISYLGYFEQTKLMSNSDVKIHQLFDRIKKVHRVIGKIGDYMMEMSERESFKEVNSKTDWTIFNREIAKIDYVLKTAIQILINIEGKLLKKKIIKQEEIENLQKFVQEEDIGSFDHLFPDLAGRRKSNDLAEPERVREETITISEYKTEKEVMREISEDAQSRNNRRLSNSSGGTFAQIQSNVALKSFLQEMKRRRYQIKKGQLLYFNYLNLKDHISILAYALNSSQFAEQLEKPSNLIAESIKFNVVVSKHISTNWEIKREIDQLKNEEPEEDELSRESYEIVVYYHQQFEELRKAQGITYDMYVRSITSAEHWEGVSGGKSNSYFAKSNDSLLVIKTIKDAQFMEFTKSAWGYINHMKSAKQNGRKPILAKIYGIYQLTIKGHSHKCIIMQNLFFKLDQSNMKVYDLKGSEANRTEVPKNLDVKFTGLDTNFKIDKNCQPYILEEAVHRELYESLQEDILFLTKNQFIDYSLLTIQSQKHLRLGIIDFMRPYHIKEKIQNAYKEIKNRKEPTVIPPHQYASRFMAAFKRYFMPKVSDLPHN